MKDLEIFRARFGAAVRRRRKEKKLSQENLAALVGVEQPTIARLENAEQGFDSATLFSLSVALELPLTELFAEVEAVTPARLPAEAERFGQIWYSLPKEMRDEYRKRIEALAEAMSHPVPDEKVRRTSKSTR